MRTDEELSHSVRACKSWKTDIFSGETASLFKKVANPREGDPEFLLKSFSGYERNRLFLNRGGHSFMDISGISGTDAVADGRAFAVWDYNRDGWLDIALVNANAPLLQLFRNDMGLFDGSRRSAGAMIAVRFAGGNRTAEPTKHFGPRDGYGAVVSVTVDDTLSLLREHRCGEGFAAQNSDTMIIGLGEHRAAKKLTVKWPSGTISVAQDIPAGTLLTIFEDAAQSPDRSGFVTERYTQQNASSL